MVSSQNSSAPANSKNKNKPTNTTGGICKKEFDILEGLLCFGGLFLDGLLRVTETKRGTAGLQMGICYYLSSKLPYQCRDSVTSASKTASLLLQPLFPSGIHSPAAAGAGAETRLPFSVTCERL